MPDDLKDLSPEEQQKAVQFKAAWMMGLGTVILVFISDPMVDVLSELGEFRTAVLLYYFVNLTVLMFDFGCVHTLSDDISVFTLNDIF